MTNITIGQKVKALREKAGLSQGQIAQFLGVDQGTISKCEKGERQFLVGLPVFAAWCAMMNACRRP